MHQSENTKTKRFAVKFCSIFRERRRSKTDKMACAPSKDSNQPGHPSSLIRVFAVRMKKAWVLSYPLSTQRRLDQTGRMPRLICLRWAHIPFCWFCHKAALMRMSRQYHNQINIILMVLRGIVDKHGTNIQINHQLTEQRLNSFVQNK